MKTKHLKATLKVKANGEPGSVQAMFSVFDVVDGSREVVLPSFFQDGQEVAMSAWGHNWGSLPVGKGVIRVTSDGAVFDGLFFLNTTAGKEHYETIKAMGDLQEWSFGFRVFKETPGTFHGQDVMFLEQGETYEVSPVLIGDNRETHTLGLKAWNHDDDQRVKDAIPPKKTATTDEAWDTGKMWKNLTGDAASLKAATAWFDPDRNPEVKATYKFIHHMVDVNGNVGAANLTACSGGIGVLNGGRSGTTIPDQDRQGVWDHLAKHLKDADKEPPPLKTADLLDLDLLEPPPDVKAVDVDRFVAAFVQVSADVASKATSMTTISEKEGRAISEARRSQLADSVSQLRQVADTIAALLKETEPAPKKDDESTNNHTVDLVSEFARTELIRAGFDLANGGL